VRCKFQKTFFSFVTDAAAKKAHAFSMFLLVQCLRVRQEPTREEHIAVPHSSVKLVALLANIRGQYYKTIRIRNLQEIDRFRSKLVTNTLTLTNTLAYYRVGRLQIHNFYSTGP
jgi:hypothetical protein